MLKNTGGCCIMHLFRTSSNLNRVQTRLRTAILGPAFRRSSADSSPDSGASWSTVCQVSGKEPNLIIQAGAGTIPMLRLY